MGQGLMILKEVEQVELDYGCPDECQVSRVHFDVETPSGTFRDLISDVKLSPGATFTGGPFEISLPDSLRGIVKYDEFRKHIEDFYRDRVGPTGEAIHLRPDQKFITVQGIRIVSPPKIIPIEIIDPKKAGW